MEILERVSSLSGFSNLSLSFGVKFVLLCLALTFVLDLAFRFCANHTAQRK